MSFGDIVYIIAMVLFVFMTFGIVKNYYKSKFDEDGHRIDMQDVTDKEGKQDYPPLYLLLGKILSINFH